MLRVHHDAAPPVHDAGLKQEVKGLPALHYQLRFHSDARKDAIVLRPLLLPAVHRERLYLALDSRVHSLDRFRAMVLDSELPASWKGMWDYKQGYGRHDVDESSSLESLFRERSSQK